MRLWRDTNGDEVRGVGKGDPLELVVRKGLWNKLLSQTVLTVGREDGSQSCNILKVQRVEGMWRNCWCKCKMGQQLWKTGSCSKGETELPSDLAIPLQESTQEKGKGASTQELDS